jgi:hypothetical protein
LARALAGGGALLALAQKRNDFFADHVEADADVLQHPRRHAFFFADQAEEEVLGADVVVPMFWASSTANSSTFLARGVNGISPSNMTLSPVPTIFSISARTRR